jgi:FlaA1/EpsC-like NDP-sugar epimerase
MIKLAGKSESELEIVYTGLRPGEKLYEEVLADVETTLPTPHPKLRVAKARHAESSDVDAITAWVSSTATASDGEVRTRIRSWLPEYRPNGQ